MKKVKLKISNLKFQKRKKGKKGGEKLKKEKLKIYFDSLSDFEFKKVIDDLTEQRNIIYNADIFNSKITFRPMNQILEFVFDNNAESFRKNIGKVFVNPVTTGFNLDCYFACAFCEICFWVTPQQYIDFFRENTENLSAFLSENYDKFVLSKDLRRILE